MLQLFTDFAKNLDLNKSLTDLSTSVQNLTLDKVVTNMKNMFSKENMTPGTVAAISVGFFSLMLGFEAYTRKSVYHTL